MAPKKQRAKKSLVGGGVSIRTKRLAPGQITKLAIGLGVDSNTVEIAIKPRGGASKKKTYNRLERVRRDLLQAFQNDEAALQRWMTKPNDSLDKRTPEDMLAEGRVDVLERLRDAIRTLQFG